MGHQYYIYIYTHMGVSKNNGTPKSSILIGFSIINHPFWGTSIYGNTHICIYIYGFPMFLAVVSSPGLCDANMSVERMLGWKN